MSNPYFDLQAAVAERLAAHSLLAPIAMVTEEKGSIEKRIQSGLARGGIKAGDSGKGGLAFLIFTPRGRTINSEGQGLPGLVAQKVVVRVALFCKPLINDGSSGHQLQPLEVHFAAQSQILTWDRGFGQPLIELDAWDSDEAADEISYYNDFLVPMNLSLQ